MSQVKEVEDIFVCIQEKARPVLALEQELKWPQLSRYGASSITFPHPLTCPGFLAVGCYLHLSKNTVPQNLLLLKYNICNLEVLSLVHHQNQIKSDIYGDFHQDRYFYMVERRSLT